MVAKLVVVPGVWSGETMVKESSGVSTDQDLIPNPWQLTNLVQSARLHPPFPCVLLHLRLCQWAPLGYYTLILHGCLMWSPYGRSETVQVLARIELRPYFRNEVVNSVPGERAVCYRSPPSRFVQRRNIRMRMKVVRYGNLWVFEWRCNETNVQVGIARCVIDIHGRR